ncbi:hypothetical protein GCM10020221_13460 [Streptomyces thioluteus]|uniref:MFS transporter n=1 Tax=Streptomyces thioluteus TaxID=66431 RepID=A0ABN3WL80_STRTU
MFLAIPVLILLPLVVMLPALRKLPRTEAGGAPDRRRMALALAVAVGAGCSSTRARAASGSPWCRRSPVSRCSPRPSSGCLPKGTFRALRGLPSVVLLRGIAVGAFLASESFIPLMLVSERGMSATTAGLSLTGGGLTWSLGAYTQSRSRLEPYRQRLMCLGLVLMAVSIAVVPLVLLDGAPVWLVAASWIVAGYGIGLNVSSSTVLALEYSPAGEEGVSSAALQVSEALGNIVLVGVAGVLFGAFGGGTVGEGAHGASDAAAPHSAFAAVYVAMTAVALAGAVVATRLRPKDRVRLA